VALLAIYLFSSLVNGVVDYSMAKRMIHMGVYVLIALCLGREMLPTRVAAKGLTTGLVVSALSGVLLFSKSTYSGRLTGIFGDPNVAGFLLAVLGPIMLSRIEKRLTRVGFAVLLLVTIGLTLSRTALLASVIFAAWLLVGKRLRRGHALLLIGILVLAIAFLPTSVQSIGPFKDRSGSDQLRNRVSSQELTSVGESPIWGHGAGTATVRVNSNDVKFFFHNSYLALLNEGGALALIAVMTMLVGVFLTLIGLDAADRDPWLECSLIGVTVMAINLGEVLVELASAIAIGFALAHLLAVRRRRAIADRVQVRM
jgi:O-antigen ligase